MENKETLEVMKTQLSTHVNGLLDALAEEGYNEEKHDVVVEFGGIRFRLNLHADLYEDLDSFIQSQIEHEREERSEL